MHSVQVHSVISQITGIFHIIGIWHHGNMPTEKELRTKLFYSLYFALVPLSMAVGSITNENRDESVFLAELAIVLAVMTAKFWILIWKQKQIEDLLHRICSFSIRDDDDYHAFNENLCRFMKIFQTLSFISVITTFAELAIFPFLGSEKTMICKFGFPLDYENDDISFWIAHLFLTSAAVLTFIPLSFTILITILLIHCSLRYQVLGSELTKMGYIRKGQKGQIFRVAQHLFTGLDDIDRNSLTFNGVINQSNLICQYSYKVFPG